MDFNGEEIKTMRINGHEIEHPRVVEMWEENKIYIEPHYLKDEVTNVIEFLVHNQFNNDQFGFVLGRDPSGEEYVYIQTVPYYASRIVPMFDQLNIKGKFSISVVHPEKDICVTTGPLLEKSKFKDFIENEQQDWIHTSAKCFSIDEKDLCISIFEHTPYLSSYLLNLVCGPLESIEATPEQCYNNIQMKIMCRSKTTITRIFV